MSTMVRFKNYRIIKIHHKKTGILIGFWIMKKENGKWFGIADGDKPLQFDTKDEAIKYVQSCLSTTQNTIPSGA
jgi:hypothetical protein